MSTTGDERRRPTLELLRDLTDAHVVDQLLQVDELTRTDLAARTKISKPTISESVRRLEAAGLIGESGRQDAPGNGRRGPSANYYRLQAGAAAALAVSIGPDGVRAELRDLRGELLAEQRAAVEVPARARRLAPLITATIEAALAVEHGRLAAVTVSTANPVDRSTGRMIRLPEAPFLTDELDLHGLLSDLIDVRPEIDNDVNWAALAEHRDGSARDLDDFVYCYLGPGLGAGLIADGAVVRGHHGLAGEFAHVLTVGPGGRSRRLLQCFADWDLLEAGSTAIDVQRLRTSLGSTGRTDRALRRAVVAALAGAIGSLTALLNPGAVVIGGPWSDVDGLVEQIAEQVAEIAIVPTEIRGATLGAQAPLIGARSEAVRQAQRSLTR